MQKSKPLFFDFVEDEYFELPRFGKYKSTEINSFASERVNPRQNETILSNEERELSQNERIRDYSPGDISINAPNMQFSGFNFKEHHNMFSHNQRSLKNNIIQDNVSHKYRIDHKLQENKRNVYHISKQGFPIRANVENTSSVSVQKQNRMFDTSNYIIKNAKNPSQTAKSKQTKGFKSNENSDTFKNYKIQKAGSIQNNKDLFEEKATYSQFHKNFEGKDRLKQFSKEHMSMLNYSKSFRKKYSCQTPMELDEMEVLSNPTMIYKKQESGVFANYNNKKSIHAGFKNINFNTLERNISDFGQNESGDRSMKSGFSGHEIKNFKGFTRNNSNIRNSSFRRNENAKYSTQFTELTGRREEQNKIYRNKRNESKTKSCNEVEQFSNRIDTNDSDIANQIKCIHICPECNANYEIQNLYSNFGVPQLHKSRTTQILPNVDVQKLQKENSDLK